jgi:hypothetical protein
MENTSTFLTMKKLIIVSLAFISLYLIVVYHGLDDSCVLIHDNLDSNVANFKLLATSDAPYFSLNGIIKNVFNGLPVSSGFSFEALYICETIVCWSRADA